ncbi:reverse transcriptase [Elysia marginata]|uniref:Reverse transcriptase n=1 Tax=Elysia marginata TaxID=1093978 RepID=A0AAV4FR40_9GAST|nr:reverse transcriptase [Elysia marginata]
MIWGGNSKGRVIEFEVKHWGCIARPDKCERISKTRIDPVSPQIYHVPGDIQVMLDDYFSGFRMRFSTNDYTTNWINLEVGIVIGCTISPIMFVMAVVVILEAAEGSAGSANLDDGCLVI